MYSLGDIYCLNVGHFVLVPGVTIPQVGGLILSCSVPAGPPSLLCVHHVELKIVVASVFVPIVLFVHLRSVLKFSGVSSWPRFGTILSSFTRPCRPGFYFFAGLYVRTKKCIIRHRDYLLLFCASTF